MAKYDEVRKAFKQQLAVESVVYVALLIYFWTLDFASGEIKIFCFGAGCMMTLTAYHHFSSGMHSFRFISIITKEHSPRAFYRILIIEALIAIAFITFSLFVPADYRGGKHSTVYESYLQKVEQRNEGRKRGGEEKGDAAGSKNSSQDFSGKNQSWNEDSKQEKQKGTQPIVFGTVVALCCFVIARMGFRRLVRQRL